VPVISVLPRAHPARPIRAALAAVLLAGCLPRGVAVEDFTPRADARACPAASLAAHVGAPFTVLAPVPLPDGLRVLRPGQVLTQDLQPRRLNAQVDGQGRILRLFCG